MGCLEHKKNPLQKQGYKAIPACLDCVLGVGFPIPMPEGRKQQRPAFKEVASINQRSFFLEVASTPPQLPCGCVAMGGLKKIFTKPSFFR